jgi:hypothetical protein
MNFSRTITFPNVYCQRDTAKALLCAIGSESHWVPKSQVTISSEVQSAGDSGDLVASAWWAGKAGIGRYGHAGNNYSYNDYSQSHGRASSSQELATANRIYRRIAAKYHPDRSPETAEIMKDINELWQAVGADLQRM